MIRIIDRFVGDIGICRVERNGASLPRLTSLRCALTRRGTARYVGEVSDWWSDRCASWTRWTTGYRLIADDLGRRWFRRISRFGRSISSVITRIRSRSRLTQEY
jgi:hypothetical protein